MLQLLLFSGLLSHFTYCCQQTENANHCQGKRSDHTDTDSYCHNDNNLQPAFLELVISTWAFDNATKTGKFFLFLLIGSSYF